MSARVESQWQGDADRVDMVVNYGGAGDQDVTVTANWDTAADLGEAIEDALNAAVGGSEGDPFVVAVHSTTGQYSITSSPSTFTLTVNQPVRAFCAFSASYGASNLAQGADYPPSQFRSLMPLPDPHPSRYRLMREAAMADSGRVVGRLVDNHPMQSITLRWGPDTGSTWSALSSWLEYAAQGIPFSLFRSTDSALYKITAPTINLDGRSLCILTQRAADIVREYLAEPSTVQGFVEFEARILEGY